VIQRIVIIILKKIKDYFKLIQKKEEDQGLGLLAEKKKEEIQEEGIVRPIKEFLINIMIQKENQTLFQEKAISFKKNLPNNFFLSKNKEKPEMKIHERKNLYNNQMNYENKDRKFYHNEKRIMTPIGKSNQEYPSNTEENFNYPRNKVSREASREISISKHNKLDKNGEEDIMSLIRNQIKIQYPQNTDN